MRAEHEKDKRKIQMLEGIARMKSEFISVLSHELKSPLAVAKQSVSLITPEVNYAAGKPPAVLLKRAQQSLQRLEKITDGLLDISRMQRGTFRLDYSLVNLKDLTKELVDAFAELAKERHIRVRMKLPYEAVNIFIDTDRVSQVLSNLLDNALKFTAESGRITVELTVLENKVRVGVIDTGIGIAPRELSRIFHKLGQVAQRSRSAVRAKGMGLGLAISKELIERHGGEIWAESELKKGSAFYFTLPRFYAANVLDKATRTKINQLLQQDVTLHLINLLVINYVGFKRLLGPRSRKVLDSLQIVVTKTVKQFRRSPIAKHADIYLTGFRKGECTIIFTEGSEREVCVLCDTLKKNIDLYLSQNNFGEIFINIGVLEFLYRAKPLSSGVVPASIYIKKIFIGAEKRDQTRYNYQLPVEPFALQACLGSSYTLDISEHGLCFISSRQLKTDSPVTIKLVIPGAGRDVSVQGRVAWIAPLQAAGADDLPRYKIGVEFSRLQQQDEKALSRFIGSIEKQTRKQRPR